MWRWSVKIRTGFVSNSSSSSFIVAYSGDEAKAVISLEIDLARLGDTFETVEQLGEYFVEEYGWRQSLEEVLEECEWTREKYNKARAAIESGKRVIIGYVSNDSSAPSNVLYSEGFPEMPDHIELIAGG
jgi:hypothetical protein